MGSLSGYHTFQYDNNNYCLFLNKKQLAFVFQSNTGSYDPIDLLCLSLKTD